MVSRRQRKIALKADPSPSSFGITPTRYAAWLAYVFDRPKPGWQFDIDRTPFDLALTSSEFVDLVGLTMTRCGTDLAAFSNEQVSEGLKYLFSSSCSDNINSFGSNDVPLEKKVTAIRAMKRLYKDCFEPRCDSLLGHLSESSGNPLNYNAYMLWNDTPIYRLTRHHAEVQAAFVDALDFALRSSNDACIESAMHGLGHERRHCPSMDLVIDRFLATTTDAPDCSNRARTASNLRPVRKALRDYARRACTGCIQ